MAHRGRPDAPRAYGGIPNLPQGYQHLTVNQSINFVDPNDHTIHTNTCEGMWSIVKHKFRLMNGTSDANFTDYLAEFIWRKNFKDNVFGQLLACIREQNPV